MIYELHVCDKNSDSFIYYILLNDKLEYVGEESYQQEDAWSLQEIYDAVTKPNNKTVYDYEIRKHNLSKRIIKKIRNRLFIDEL